MTPDRSRANDIDEARIETLGREVYGEGYEQFLVTLDAPLMERRLRP